MGMISFRGYEFSPKDVKGDIECPLDIRNKMVKIALGYCPSDVVVTDYTNSTTISHGDKKIIVSVWKFGLTDIQKNSPLNHLVEDGSDIAVVWGIHFYNNGKFCSDVCDLANLKCALGYSLNEERRAMFMLGTKVAQYTRPMGENIKLFFIDSADPLIDLIAKHLPSGSDTKSTLVSLSASVPVNDYKVSVHYREGKLRATIPHKYTMTDNVYGAQYRDYGKSFDMNTSEDVDSFDWQGLWNDLYENRNGTCVYRGSLGS